MEFALRKDRIGAAIATVLIEGAILYALLMGVKVVPPAAVAEAIEVFTVSPPPPPPRKPPPPQAAKPRAKAKEGAASPKNIQSRATQIVAPKPPPYVPPPPIEATLKPDFGRVSTSGAADVRGPGTGSGGIGEGTGSGRGGFGPGGGGGEGSPPVHISGRIRDADYPGAALDGRMTGTLTVIVTIEPNGRVSDCDVVRSSRSAILDETTCRLIQERYRYRPARDEHGRPVRARESQNHTWVIDERDRPPPRW